MLTPTLLNKSIWGIPGILNGEESDGESVSDGDSMQPERDDGALQTPTPIVGPPPTTPPQSDSGLNTPHNELETDVGFYTNNTHARALVTNTPTNLDATDELRAAGLPALGSMIPLDHPLATSSVAISTVTSTVNQESPGYGCTPGLQGYEPGPPTTSALAPRGKDPAVRDMEDGDAISEVNTRTTYSPVQSSTKQTDPFFE
ncbi:hypothetical protein FRC11_001560 [Ceratobasidium sp. 423]|nr:hypothetical protein FRC11_001560 [Ceratobasidium sp. 423]